MPSAATALTRVAVPLLRRLVRTLVAWAGGWLRRDRADQLATDRLRDVIEMLPEAIVLMDRDDRLVLWNRRYAELYPEIADVLRPGVSFRTVLKASLATGDQPEEIGDPEAWLDRRMAEHAKPCGTTEQRFRDGRWVRHQENRTSDGGIVSVRIDITDLKRREESFRLLFRNNPVPMWLAHPETGRFLEVNEAAVAHYGYALDTFLTLCEADLRAGGAPDEAGGPPDHATGPEPVWRHRTADGRIIEVMTFVRQLPHDAGLANLVAVFDVTERLRAEARLAHLARHDALTGLPNRVQLRDRLAEAIGRVRRGGRIAVHCLDLDHFKVVNDMLGHPTGDLLLQAVSARLRDIVREHDCVARLGGDEFVVLQCDVERPEDAGELAQRLITAVSAPYRIADHAIVVGLTIGTALSPDDSLDAETLIRNADTALYRAKDEGRHTFRFFEPEMDARLQLRRALELDLAAALSMAQFEIYYQPLIDLSTNEICGFEALLRWHHPVRGLISPAQFIPLAEQTGLIVPLGDWVVREACREAAGWPGHIKVAVNLSPMQFKGNALVQTIVAALDASGLAPSRLELELTESALLQDNEATLSILHQLRRLGIAIALDDFGTGYSSLSYLRRFPFTKIKIDRSFVRELADNSDCVAIVRAVVGLGISLGMLTTAEGIETEEHLRLVRQQGCTEGQGYLFGPPAPAALIGPLLARPSRRVAAVA